MSAARPVKPQAHADLYRPEAVAFQRFKMIGQPMPRSPTMFRALVGATAAFALCVFLIATARYSERIEAIILDRDQDSGSLTLGFSAVAAPSLDDRRPVVIDASRGLRFRASPVGSPRPVAPERLALSYATDDSRVSMLTPDMRVAVLRAPRRIAL